MNTKTFLNAINIFLFATLLIPFIITTFSPFPFVFGKMMFVRAVVEGALAVALVLLARASFITPGRIVERSKELLRSPLFLLIIGFFVLSGLASTLVAPVFSKAFFGEVERGEGFLGLLHYVVFLVLAASLFTRREWRRYFVGLTAVGVVMSFYAWLQYLGVERFPFALRPLAQPGSFTGNAAYLTAFLVVLLAVNGVLFTESKRRSVRTLVGLSTLFFVATIFITAIRGALIGVGAGVLVGGLAVVFSKTTSRTMRWITLAFLALVVAFGTIFWLTRSSGFWADVPGLYRFTRLTFETPSVQTRLIGLGVSFNAWKERPLFGWGLEHYNVAYNKYYDPAYAIYAEDWFDRAHNKIAEVAVIQGTVGLILYLALFGFTIWMIRQSPWLLGAVVAYVVQGLFLFDNITSYLPLFAFWAYLLSTRRVMEAERNVARPGSARAATGALGAVRWGGIAVALLFLPLLVYHAYTYLYIPVAQAKTYDAALKARVGKRILEASDKFFYPYNFLQPTLRGQFVDQLSHAKLLQNQSFRPLVLRVLAALEESAEREAFEPRQYIRLIEAYNELAKEDPTYYEKSFEFAKRARELTPRRQGVLNHFAFVLAGLNRFEEAIATNREMVALAPEVYKSHYHLGMILALTAHAPDKKGTPAGEALAREALAELDRAWELAKVSHHPYLFFLKSDFENLKIIYTRLGAYERTAQVLEVAITVHPKEKQFYIDAISIYRTLRNPEGIISIAERLKQVDPELIEDLDTIIDLARKRKWEILDTL